MAVVLGRNGLAAEDVYDGLNVYGTRKYENVDWGDYNCFGFAFQTFSWLHPLLTRGTADYYYDNEGTWSLEDSDAEDRIENWCSFPMEVEDDEIKYLNENFGDEYVRQNYGQWDYSDSKVVNLMVKNILKAFPDTRIIKDPTELEWNEYAIYMCGCYYDFHFCVYDPTRNRYFHKRGGWAPEAVVSPAEAFGLKYYGKVVCFAKKGFFDCDVDEDNIDENGGLFI